MKPFELIDNPKSIDEQSITALLKAGTEVIVQFSQKSYTGAILDQLNELCGRHNDQLCIRFYGHYSGSFDCKTVLKIPHVKNLQVDCLTEAINTDALTQLSNLSHFTLGIFELANTELLNSPNFKQLEELVITETKTKAFNLDYLRQYTNLKTLKIAGHTKNIDAIGEIAGLETLLLNNIKKTPIAFVNRLPQLTTLGLLLGSRENINEVENNAIKNLDITFVRGFNELNNIGRFSNLEKLHIEDEAQLATLHFDNLLSHLTDVKLLNCKILTSITGLNMLTTLESLIISGTAVDFNRFIQQPLPKKLKHLGFYTHKSKQDMVIKATLEEKGYTCD